MCVFLFRRNKDVKRLETLLFKSEWNEKIQNDGLFSETFSDVNNILNAASAEYNGEIGRIVPLDSLKIHVGFVLLSDVNDQTGSLRAQLPKRRDVFTCSPTTVFYDASVTRLRPAIDTEVENLWSWISNEFEYGTVLILPEEVILVDEDVASRARSVTERLIRESSHVMTSGDGFLVFIRHTSADVIKSYRTYIRKWLAVFVDKILSELCPVCVVFDVGKWIKVSPEKEGETNVVLDGIFEMKDIFIDLLQSVNMKVYCGVNPIMHRCSCIAVHMSV